MQDLGWSCDSSILVTVGLDSKIVIWSGHSFEKLKTISQHQSHVKGITFDPANKYFATASDDRTIKIFRFTSPPANANAFDQANNFVLEGTVTAPFAHSPLTTYFRRASWSPDGNHIAAANAVNGPVSSVAIINRGSWDSDINLIGHEGPVEVCAFSPRMFFREPLKTSQIDQNGHPSIPSVTVIACAGQDKSLSIWNTSFARPLVVAQGLTKKSISDLCWTPDGETLYMVSLDGSIMAVVFEPGELGYPAPLSENDRTLAKYGAGRKAGIIEGPDALLLEESSKAGELKGAQGRMDNLMGDGEVQGKPITNGDATKVNGTASTATPAVNAATTTAGAEKTPAAPATPAEQTKAQIEAKIQQQKSRIEIVNGKKRIKPLLVASSSNVAESSLPQTQLLAAGSQGARPPSDAPQTLLDLSKPYDGLPRGGLAALLIGNKRKFAEIEGDEERRIEKRLAQSVQDGAAPIVVNGVDGLMPPSMAAKPQKELAEALRPAIANPALAVSQVRLAVPILRSVITRAIGGSEPSKDSKSDTNGTTAIDDKIMLEARNPTGPSRTGRAQDRDPARINCTRGSQSLWQDYVPKSVLLVTGNVNFWAAACDDGSIFVWTPAGRRLLNPLILEAQPCIMDCRGWWLMCISAVGMCYVWNIKTLSSPHPPVSVAPILDIAIHSAGPHLTMSPGIVFARLNSQGRLVVAMSNGDGYTYSPMMYIWQRLSEPWWAIGSQYWSTTDSSIGTLSTNNANGTSTPAKALNSLVDEVSEENLSAGIIPLLERNTTAQSQLRGRAFFLQRLIKALIGAEGFEGFEASVSVAHLENRVAAALTLGAREEFRVYLLMYAKRLGAEGLKGKIEELLRTLLGDIFTEDGEKTTPEEAAGRGWNLPGEEICGWQKHQLLKEVVLVLGKLLSSICPLLWYPKHGGTWLTLLLRR